MYICRPSSFQVRRSSFPRPPTERSSLYTDPLNFLGLVGAFGFPNGKRLSDPQRKIKEKKTPLRTQERNPQKGKIVGPVSSMENPKIKTGTFLFFFWISPHFFPRILSNQKIKGGSLFYLLNSFGFFIFLFFRGGVWSSEFVEMKSNLVEKGKISSKKKLSISKRERKEKKKQFESSRSVCVSFFK